jgi:Ribbon-helix-helix protein, copG family
MENRKKPLQKGRKPGRKPLEGVDLRKFLATLEAETIKGLKLAAIQEGKSASEILEEATAQWLERWKAKAAKS